jgi:hypothetical protein
MIELLDKLRNRIADYRRERITGCEYNERRLISCCSIEIAIVYAELHFKNKRKISKSEIVFFQGGRYISDTIGEPLYEDIYDMYYELSNEINEIFQ